MQSGSSQRRARQRKKEGMTGTRARVATRLVIIERNILRTDVIVPMFDFIDQLIQDNHWDYLYKFSGIVYPRLV
jgi:hypothetical protein